MHLKLLFLMPCIMLNLFNAKAQSTSDYKLVWADEFNKNGVPDSSTWTYENGFVRNQEFQWYQRQNARCENGKLILKQRK